MTKILFSLLALISALFSRAGFGPPLASPPCAAPLVYNIGSFDRRFGLTQADFLSALREAEAVWEEPLRGEGLSPDTQLFKYSPEQGALKINLIYDYRQETTKALTQIEGAVKEDKSDYEQLEAKYRSLKAEHDVLKSAYDTEADRFNTANARYQEDVDRWNSGPRTSESEFKTLEAERVALEKSAGELKVLEASLNAKVRELNAMVERVNALAKALNLNVKEYNAVGAARGDTYPGGIYTSDEAGERIDIFEFQNHGKLVRVLAHELGHALGLDHVEDPKAIMYYLDEGTSDKATATDIAALKTLCRVQ